MTTCIEHFHPVKFIVGLGRLDFLDPLVKIKKIFKVYRPAVSLSLYDCRVMEGVLRVESSNGRILRMGQKRYSRNSASRTSCFSMTSFRFPGESTTPSRRKRRKKRYKRTSLRSTSNSPASFTSRQMV